MRITVVGGTGYVALTTAVCLAAKGHTVYSIGRSEEKRLISYPPIHIGESSRCVGTAKSHPLVPVMIFEN